MAPLNCGRLVLPRVAFLYRGYARAQFYWNTVGDKDQLQFGHESEQIRDVVIAQVGYAENPPRHLALSVGDDGAEFFVELPNDNAGA